MKPVPEAPPGWKPIHVAPAETDICICVEDAFGIYPLRFLARSGPVVGSTPDKACH